MKVLFICSSLEPGRDGVGDYTRRLAGELIKQGHYTTIISLNDKYIANTSVAVQKNEGVKLNVLRLGSSQPLKNRLSQAKRYILEFNPDWISLQFVIFGYHPKGLPLWINKLSTLGEGRQWHIMFHELWLGMEIDTPKKHLLWGGIQKIIIKSLIKTLKPAVIQTNTLLYRQSLFDIGFKADHLPLFGNIPVVNRNKTKSNKIFDDERCIKLVLFGHIHPNAPVSGFFKELTAYAIENNLSVSLTLIGICGSHQEDWIKECKLMGVSVTILGEKPADYISDILSKSTLGISTTPPALLEKSGSVAAMREHNLPVLCVSSPWHPKQSRILNLPNGIGVYKQGNLNSLFIENSSNLPGNNISLISTRFINSLLNNSQYG